MTGIRRLAGSRGDVRINVAVLILALTAGCGGAGADDGERTASSAAESPPANAASTEASQAGSGQECLEPKLNPETGDPVRIANLTVGTLAVKAEIADTPRLRESGLMNRKCLPENYGMLFVYGDEAFRSFWMRNTPISLDIAFLDRSGVLINILTMDPQTDENYASTAPAMFALEMEGGWFEAKGIQAGDKVQF